MNLRFEGEPHELDLVIEADNATEADKLREVPGIEGEGTELRVTNADMNMFGLAMAHGIGYENVDLREQFLALRQRALEEHLGG